MKLEKTVKMTVDAVKVERQDGKKDLKLRYSLEESSDNQLISHGVYTEMIPYEQLLEIQKQSKRRSA